LGFLSEAKSLAAPFLADLSFVRPDERRVQCSSKELMYPLLVTSNEVYGELGYDFNSSAAVLGTAACSVVSLTNTGIF